MGTYYKWKKYEYSYVEATEDLGQSLSFYSDSTSPTFNVIQNSYTPTLITSGNYAGNFKVDVSQVERILAYLEQNHNFSAKIFFPSYSGMGNYAYVTNYYSSSGSSGTLFVSMSKNYEGPHESEWFIEPSNGQTIINHYVDMGKGDFIEYVYSTSSTGYPNGAAADGYWYIFLHFLEIIYSV